VSDFTASSVSFTRNGINISAVIFPVVAFSVGEGNFRVSIPLISKSIGHGTTFQSAITPANADFIAGWRRFIDDEIVTNDPVGPLHRFNMAKEQQSRPPVLQM
jgi:hypothetical protein